MAPGRRCPSDAGAATMSAVHGGGGSHLLGGLHACGRGLPEDPQPREKSVIAQPIFVFEKRKQTFKRPAEETLHGAAEPECNGFSRKRIRSSSFSLETTDPQPRGGKKNNVFMTPTLVQRNVGMNSAEQSPLKHPERVLRPAILQPPRAPRREKVRHNAQEPCKTREKTKNKVSEKDSCLLSEDSPSAGISVRLSTNQVLVGAASAGCQPNEDKYSFKSCSSDFVFGENMVERVLGVQKLTQPQHENDLHAKEKPLKYTPKFPTNSPRSGTDAIKNISLIESAAALSSKSSPQCLLEKIDVITGEEAEYNVLKINCKLFVFNTTTPCWTERGRGALRLNDTAGSDRGAFQSRLIMRNQGSLRLILNSKLWTRMELQRASHRNLRITATDLEDYSIRVFLIQASAKDTASLYAAIHHRLVALRSFEKQKDVHQAESQAEAVLPPPNCDSCDEEEDGFTRGTNHRPDPARWTHQQSVACS